jgi:hypothetical protein
LKKVKEGGLIVAMIIITLKHDLAVFSYEGTRVGVIAWSSNVARNSASSSLQPIITL